MTPDQLAGAERLCEAATKGPWRSGPHYRHDIESPVGRVGTIGNMGAPQAIADAAFIAHARTFLPDLIAAYRALEAENQRLKALAEARQKDINYHADCRPNRQQAERAMADAKATNDKWADEVAAHRATAEYRDALRAKAKALVDKLRVSYSAIGSALVLAHVHGAKPCPTYHEELAALAALVEDK